MRTTPTKIKTIEDDTLLCEESGAFHELFLYKTDLGFRFEYEFDDNRLLEYRAGQVLIIVNPTTEIVTQETIYELSSEVYKVPTEATFFLYLQNFSVDIGTQITATLHYIKHRYCSFLNVEGYRTLICGMIDSDKFVPEHWANPSGQFFKLNIPSKICLQVMGNIGERRFFSAGDYIELIDDTPEGKLIRFYEEEDDFEENPKFAFLKFFNERKDVTLYTMDETYFSNNIYTVESLRNTVRFL